MRRALFLIVGLCALTRLAAAQERSFMDPDGNLIQYDERPIGMARIRVACAADSAESVSQLRDEEFKLAAAAAADPDDRDSWKRLGCARALLYAARSMAHPGFLMPLGTPWAGGTIAVLLRAVDRWPDDPELSQLLATVALESLAASNIVAWKMEHRTRMDDQPPGPPAVRLWAVLHSRRGSPIEYRACVSLSLELTKYGDASWCAGKALALGMDSTWHLLRLSYLASRDHRLLDGKLDFDLAVTSAHTPAMRAEVGWHLVHRSRGMGGNLKYTQPWMMMSRAVNDTIFALPDSAFPGWVARRNRALLQRDWPTTAIRLFKHFHAVIASGGGFRNCIAFDVWNSDCPGLFGVAWRGGVLDAASYRVWDEAGASVVALVPMRIEPPDCDKPAPVEESLHLRYRRWDARSRQWSSRAIEVPFRRSPSDKSDGCVRNALLEFASNGAPGTWAVGVVADSNAWSADADGVLLPLADTPLALSDLVIGRPGLDPELRLNGEMVATSPTDRFDSGDTFSVFFQVRAEQPADSARIAIYVLKLDDHHLPEESGIRLTFPARLGGRFTDVLRLLSFGTLDSGDYLLRVTVSAGALSGSAERGFTIE